MDDMAMVADAEMYAEPQMAGLGAAPAYTSQPTKMGQPYKPSPLPLKTSLCNLLIPGSAIAGGVIGYNISKNSGHGAAGAVMGGIAGLVGGVLFGFTGPCHSGGFFGLSDDVMTTAADKKQTRLTSVQQRRQAALARQRAYWAKYAEKNPAWAKGYQQRRWRTDLPAVSEGGCPDPYELFTTRPLFGEPETICVKKCRTGMFDNADGTMTWIYRTRDGACITRREHVMPGGDGGGGGGGD